MLYAICYSNAILFKCYAICDSNAMRYANVMRYYYIDIFRII